MNVKVTKSEPPESTEIMAASITKISDGFAAMMRGGLNQKAIIILIQAETKLSQRDIKTVLDAIPRLKGWYCK